MKQQKQQKQQRTITLLGKQIGTRKLQKLIHDTTHDAKTVYQDVYNALNRGIAEEIARNLPQRHLLLLVRYERAVKMYDDYQQHYRTPRADRILTPAKPSTPHHIAHFICASTSDKPAHFYTQYRVTLLKEEKTLRLVCNCPDYDNFAGAVPCKHVLLVCMWLRDYLRGMYR